MTSPRKQLLKRANAVLCLLGLAQLAAAQDTPRFTSVQRGSDGDVVLQASGQSGLYYRFEASVNLLDWVPLLTARSTGSLQHTDSATAYFGVRFYRALQLSGTNVLTGDHLLTEAGEVVIRPINHASLILGWNGKMIYIDPVGGASPYQGLGRADLVLITHGHSDHFDSATLTAVRGASAVLIAPPSVYNSMSTALKSATLTLANGAKTNVLGLAVEAVPAYNLTTSNHPKGTGNGYVVTIGGRRLYVSGDTEDTPETRALREVDVAFLSMNVPYTMTLSKAVSAVRDFRPKVVYPYHFRNSDSTYTDLNAFKRQVGTDWGTEVRIRKWY